MSDPVSHPPHYNQGKIEVIEFIEDQGLGFHLGNVVKYVARAGKKGGEGKSLEELEWQDLRKAKWYLHRRIAILADKLGLEPLPRPNEMKGT